MKTSKLKMQLVAVLTFFFWLQGFSQLVGMRIDVNGATTSDKMWIFSVSTCTRNFDNGWDGYKSFSSSPTTQIYACESDGNYQIDVVPDLNNTYIGFIAGKDSTYTLTFTNQLLSNCYDKLYLVDSIANKVIDIYRCGTQYTFTATNKTPVIRFKIVTQAPTKINNTTSVINTFEQPKKLKIYSASKNIYINNLGNQAYDITIYSAISGKVINTLIVNSNGITKIDANLPTGAYIIKGNTETEKITEKILIF